MTYHCRRWHFVLFCFVLFCFIWGGGGGLFYEWSLHVELTKSISADSQLSYKLKRNFKK